MRQTNSRQKFQDLRFLTFQDWILPNYSNQPVKAQAMMKNQSMPVFSYTKMETSPPLSTITSQFAWAGHSLPDLVQEQSNRLLRRLERPRTADNRIPIFKHSQMKGHKISRPSTAMSFSMKMRTPHLVTMLGVSGKKFDTSSNNEDTSTNSNEYDESMEGSVDSAERSSSPDFMADLYKEYERKLSTECNDKEIQTTRSDLDEMSPTTKLLRKPGIHLRNKKESAHKVQANVDTKIHCIVKLPNEQSNGGIFEDNCPPRSREPIRAQNNIKKSDTWIDLSQLCETSEEDEDVQDAPRKTEDSPRLRILERVIQSQDSFEHEVKKVKPKHSRPSSSKNPHKHSRPKSKRRKKRLYSSNTEECTRETKAPLPPTAKSGSTERLKSSDKLREEIETQMSKLDVDTNNHQNMVIQRNPVATRRGVKDPIMHPQLKPTFLGISCAATTTVQTRLPIKKIPIQILSDPFMTREKTYQKEREPEKVMNTTIEERLKKTVNFSENLKFVANSKRTSSPWREPSVPKLYPETELERIQTQLKSKGVLISTARLKRGLTRPAANTYDDCVHRLPASTSITLLHGPRGWSR